MAKDNAGKIMAAITGAAIGAAAAIALSDRNTRRTLKKAAGGMRERGEEVFHEIRSRAKESERQLKRKGAQLKRGRRGRG